MADQKPTTAEIVIMAGGGAALIGSFLDYRYESSLWTSGAFPAFTIMAILAGVMAIVVALKRFAGVSLPANIAGFNWTQIHLILGFFASLYAVAFLVLKGGGREIGTWLVTAGCIAALVGAVMMQKEGATSGPGPSV